MHLPKISFGGGSGRKTSNWEAVAPSAPTRRTAPEAECMA